MFFCGISLISSLLFAEDSNANTDQPNAKAYKAYLMTFAWPEKNTVEHIEYEELLSLKATPKFENQEEGNKANNRSNSADIAPINNPFGSYQNKIKSGVKVLTNNTWTLIFNGRGHSLTHQFNSNPLASGYAELQGSIKIKLGRYLESDIQLNHYKFNFITAEKDTIKSTENDTSSIPTSLLTIHQRNKTASKKLNYIDHPTIGALLYFEPMDIEEAIQQQALENLMSNIQKISNTNTLN